MSPAFTTGGKSRLLRRKERLDPTTLSEVVDVVQAHGWSVTLHGIDHPSDDVVVTAGQGNDVVETSRGWGVGTVTWTTPRGSIPRKVAGRQRDQRRPDPRPPDA